MLDSCDFFGEAGIKDLIDRALISISNGRWIDLQSKEFIKMHDLVQEMGRAIAREQRSRLFTGDDVYQVLTNNQSDGHVQAISLDRGLDFELEHANFEKMYQLRFLCVTHYSLVGNIVSLDLPNSLRYLEWRHYPWKSLPSKFSTQNLVVLDMRYSKVEGQLWNENQSPVNLKWIDLGFSKHLTKVPNLSRSLNIEHIDLSCCKSLVEIPSYFQHLSKLTYLDLENCESLKNLPEMPCNLEFLNLSLTAIEELPSSVWSHEKISHLDIKYCGHLKSLPSNSCKLKLLGSFSLESCKSLCEFWELPSGTTMLDLSDTSIKELRNTSIESVVGLTAITLSECESLVNLPVNIWKLKSLKSIDLSLCHNFQHFPEVSEAMEHLEFLNLSCTAVKELPPSIGNLVVLRNLDLSSCYNLVSLPTNIWKLKSLQSIDLSWCSIFENFPEVSEAMEHLEFLNLSITKVKEVPPSIGNLVALRKLHLNWCSIQEVPDDLFCLTSLQELDMRNTKIKSIPASIRKAAQLSRLFLYDCKSLESLPVLPPLLQCLEAPGCTSLKTVSSSSITITQGWEEYIFSRGLHEKHIFYNCPKLDENARSNIMGDAQLRIMRMATASSKFKEDKIEEASSDSNEEFLRKRSFAAICCPGNEIPNWFSHKSEGCSIKIELPRDWFSTDFLGFALSLVVAVDRWECDLDIICKYNFKASNGESHEVNHPLYAHEYVRDSHEVYVWYNNVFEEVVEGAQSLAAFYKLVTEVNVHFTVTRFDGEPIWVEKCGICLLYGKDVEMIKQRAL
ncbi:hypothetical protein ACE6H2_027887 [Prunus campanulata]